MCSRLPIHIPGNCPVPADDLWGTWYDAMFRIVDQYCELLRLADSWRELAREYAPETRA